MRRQRGFTLVELMVVVAMTTVIASMAILAMRRSRTQGDVDKFANQVRVALLQARRRATATREPYMVDVQKKSVRWCRVKYDKPPLPLATTQTTCPPSDATYETGVLMRAGYDAQATKFAAAADATVTVGGAAMATTYTAAPTKVNTPQPIYFGPNGTVDEDFVTVMTGLGTTLGGVTVYIEPVSSAADPQRKRRRVITYGASARPRIVDNW